MVRHQIHWAVPTEIVVSFAFGILFAVGHHLFYASLRGQPVDDAGYNVLSWQLSRQQVNITAGTIFAFLVNFSLSAAVVAAYAQVFWKSMLHRNATLESLDTTFTALGDILALLKLHVWRYYPLLFCLAIVAWAMPLASTVTPGTLAVGTAPIDPPPSRHVQVPNAGFESLNFVGSMPRAPGDSEDSTQNNVFAYNGPSTTVQRITSEVLGTGSILPMNIQYSNASWTLKFPGPGLECVDVSQAQRSRVQIFLENHLDIKGACTAQGYLAWVGDEVDLGSNMTVSFGGPGNSSSLGFNIIALPHMMDIDEANSLGDVSGGEYIPYTFACLDSYWNSAQREARFKASTMMQCQLRNVTYHASFEYNNGRQNISVTSDIINDKPINKISSIRGIGRQYPDDFKNGIDCSVLSGVTPNYDDPCSIDQAMLRTLSYQAIFDAFESIISGSVSRVNAAPAPSVNTSIQNTVLVNTPELRFLRPTASEPGTAFDPLQGYIQGSNSSLFDGLVNTAPLLKFGTLSQTVESLFRNVTVSMMSSAVLQPNLTSAFAPQPVEVTLNNYHNIYIYSAAKLWIAYGLAIFFALITAAVGLWSLVANGASYSNNFSTIFRVARGAAMTVSIAEQDADGQDPLPSYLSHAEVLMSPTSPAEAEAESESDKVKGVKQGSNILPSPVTRRRPTVHTNGGS